MTLPVAPTLDHLRQAYAIPNPARHRHAEAVLSGNEGLTILLTAKTAEGDRSTLVRLDHDGHRQWVREYAPSLGAAHALARLPDGSFVLAGDLQLSPLEFVGHLTLVSPAGELLTSAAFGPPGASGLVTVASLPGPQVLAGGIAAGKGWLLGTGSTLRADWEEHVEDAQDLTSLAPLPQGCFAAALLAEQSTTGFGVTHLTAFDAQRTLLWQRSIPTEGRGELAAILALPDGSIVSVGHHSDASSQPTQVWVVKVNPRGDLLWQVRLGPANQEQRGRAIAATLDGRLLVASDGLLSGRRVARVRCLSSQGAVLWEQPCEHQQADTLAKAIAPCQPGGLVVVGSVTPQNADAAPWILRLDDNGSILWEKVLHEAY